MSHAGCITLSKTQHASRSCLLVMKSPGLKPIEARNARSSSACVPYLAYARLAALFLRSRVMLIESREIDPGSGLQEPKAAWAGVWHLWTVILPRQSITGRLVFGKVWRRHAGRRWIYKKFIQRGGGGSPLIFENETTAGG